MAGPKNSDNTQFGLASSNATRAGGGAASVAAGNGVEPLVDLEGRQYVVPVGGPLPGFNTPWQTSSGSALVTGAQLLAGPGLLEQVSGFVQAASDTAVNYVQLYDLAAAPTVETPVQSIRIVGSQVWSWSPQRWSFGAGIYFAVSSAPLSYVISDSAFYNALGWQAP